MIDLYSPQPDSQIDLFHQDTPQLPPDVVTQRVEKANFALGEASPGVTAITAAVSSGNEKAIRDYAANQQMLQREDTRRQVLQEAINTTKKPLSADDISFFQSLTQKQLSNPDTALEEEFSRRLVNTTQSNSSSEASDSPLPNGETRLQKMDVAEFQSTRNQIAVKEYEDLQALAQKRGTTDKVFDAVGQSLPFLWWWQGQNVIDTGSKFSNVLPGDNWDAQSTYLHLLNPQDMQRELHAAVTEMYKYSPDRALSFAQYVVSHGTADTFLNNLLGVGDLADAAATVGKIGIKAGAKLFKSADVLDTGKSLKDVLKSSGETKVSGANVIASTGDTESAAKLQAGKTIQSKLLQIDNSYRGADLWNTVPSITNPRSFGTRSLNFSREETQRLIDGAIVRSNKLQQALTEPALAKRLALSADDLGFEQTAAAVRRDWTGPKDAILDIAPKVQDRKISDVATLETHLGRPDGTLFTSRRQAMAYASKYNLPTGSFNPRQMGNKFYLSVEHDINESDLNVLAKHALDTTTQSHKGFSSYINGWLSQGALGAPITPENVVSELSRDNRHVATHSLQGFYQYVESVAKDIGTIPSKERKQLQEFLDVNRDFHTEVKDPKTGEIVHQFGQDMKTLGDFEQAFKNHSGSWPTEKQTSGFLTMKQLSDTDYILKNLGMHRDLASRGYAYREFRIEGNTVRDVIAKDVDFIPKQSDSNADADILYINKNGSHVVFRRNSLSEDEISKLNRKVKDEGLKIVQIANPVQRPLKGHGIEEPVNFIINTSFGHRPLDLKLLPYSKAIGHSAYEGEWYGKQAIVTKYADKLQGKSFKTAKGSVYQVHEDGTTTRTKAYRPEHGVADQGLKERSVRTQYISQADHARISVKGNNLVIPSDVVRHTEPAVGLHPYETWKGKYHFGNPITEVDSGSYRFGHNYEGDRATSVHGTEAEARKYVPQVEKGRQLLRDKDFSGLSKHLRDNLPIYDTGDFKKMFGPDGLDLHQPIVVTRKNEKVIDALKTAGIDMGATHTNLNNLTDSPYNAWKDIPLEFTGQRDLDLNTIKETPAGLRLDTAPKIHSYEMMTKAMASASRDRFFKNYQTQAVGTYIREFAGAFKDDTKTLMRNPIEALNNPVWSNSADKGFIAHAQANRVAILSFLGQQNKVDQLVDNLNQKLLNSIYNNLGQKASDLGGAWAITRIDKPFAFLRACAFRAKLGFMNPIAVLNNSIQLTTATAITGNPLRAASSLAGAILMRYANVNVKHLDTLAKIAGNLGWPAEDFKAAYEGMKRTGFDQLKGDIGYINDALNPRLFYSKTNAMLHKGDVLFNGSERIVRLHAWGIAWQEFKKKFPDQAIGDRELGRILTRADDLSGNMTSASTSSLQKGLWGTTLQFFTFQQRLMEQMLGKRLTVAERSRILMTNSILFGVPTALTGTGGVVGAIGGAALGTYNYASAPDNLKPSLMSIPEDALKGAVGPFWPLYDDIREEGLAHGVPMDNIAIRAIMEGLPALAIHAMFGSDTNFGQKYGPNGTTMLKDIFHGDKSTVDILQGASGSILDDTLRVIDPIATALWDAFTVEPGKYPLVMKDFTNLATEGPISTLSTGAKMVYALETGKYMSKNDVQQADQLSTWDSILIGFGLSPKAINDAFLMKDHESQVRKAKDAAKPEIFRNMRLAGQASISGDKDNFSVYMTRVHALIVAGGFRDDEYTFLFQQGTQHMGESMVNSLKRDFFLKPQSQDEQGRSQLYLQQQEGNQ